MLLLVTLSKHHYFFADDVMQTFRCSREKKFLILYSNVLTHIVLAHTR